MIGSEIISSILQLLIFTSIPFVVFLITHKTYKDFFQYIGLYRPNMKSVYLAAAASVFFLAMGLGLALWSPQIKAMMAAPETVVGKLKASGTTGTIVVLLLVIAWVKTSLAEEIFFRGFIGKRLIKALGFYKGNFLQALIFGLVHLVLFWTLTKAGGTFLLFAFLLPGIAGYTIGYIKEKMGNGSIIPGWIAHGLGNTLAFSILTFYL